MHLIKPIGRYLPKDQNGFLINDCHWEKVPLHWQTIVDQVIGYYQVHLDTALHSIYLRGSLPAGIAIDGIADLDTFALVRKECHWEPLPWATEIKQRLLPQFPFVSEIEIVQSGIDQQNRLTNKYLAPILKLQSICLWGENIIPTLPDYRPGKILMRNRRWIKEDIKVLANAKNESSASIKSALKAVLRTGFELVMEREQSYTSDLYPCWKSFSQYYPEWEGAMEKVLQCFLQEPLDPKELAALAKGLGAFLIEEVEKV